MPIARKVESSMICARYGLITSTLPRPNPTVTQSCATAYGPALTASTVPVTRTGAPADSSASPPTSMSNASPTAKLRARTAAIAFGSVTVATSVFARSWTMISRSSQVA